MSVLFVALPIHDRALIYVYSFRWTHSTESLWPWTAASLNPFLETSLIHWNPFIWIIIHIQLKLRDKTGLEGRYVCGESCLWVSLETRFIFRVYSTIFFMYKKNNLGSFIWSTLILPWPYTREKITLFFLSELKEAPVQYSHLNFKFYPHYVRILSFFLVVFYHSRTYFPM